MNWIGQDQFGNYKLSGNLIKEFADDKVPKGYQTDWSQSGGNNAWNPFWVYTNEGLQLSSYCNWRFYYLDESYQKAFGVTVNNTSPNSPLRVPVIRSPIC